MNHEISSHLRSSNALKSLTPVLRNWVQMVEEFSRHDPSDACYWYNERASLSVLAGAAWRTSRWVALEEFATNKKSEAVDAETGKITHRSGRCDLYIAGPSGKAQFAIEAKQAWQPLGYRVKDSLSKVKATSKRAWKDAGALHKGEASHRLALTICIPSISMRTLGEHAAQGTSLEQLLCDWVKRIKKELRPDAFAYVFPKRLRELTNEDHLRIYPGVFLIFRKRSRSKRVTRGE